MRITLRTLRRLIREAFIDEHDLEQKEIDDWKEEWGPVPPIPKDPTMKLDPNSTDTAAKPFSMRRIY